MAARTNGERSPSRYDVRLVQVKPAKGRYRENLAESSEIFEQIAAEPTTPDLIVFPGSRDDRLFFGRRRLRSGATGRGLCRRSRARLARRGAGEREVDIVLRLLRKRRWHVSTTARSTFASGARTTQIVHVHRKMFLPTYGVFDEERFLSRGRRLQAFPDAYRPRRDLDLRRHWHAIMPTIAAVKGARVLIVPCARPDAASKAKANLKSLRTGARSCIRRKRTRVSSSLRGLDRIRRRQRHDGFVASSIRAAT